MFAAILAAFALQAEPAPTIKPHAFDTMNDEEMCADIRRRVARPQNTNPPFSARTDTADCAAKRIRASVSVEAEGEEFDRALLNFLTVARRNICNFERPSMRAFAGRGWRYTYTFTAANGELRRAEVEC